MKLREIVEGKVRLLVPDLEELKKNNFVDPAWAPVFYNPKMVFNRDLSVLFVSVISPKSVIDALSATGIRGLRYYIENNVNEVILNDKNPIAYNLMIENVKLNNIPQGSIKVYNRDANSLLFEIYADFIDIDPFGSPIPFVLASVKAAGKRGYVAYTATDLAPLEGSHKNSCRRKYGAINEKLSFSKEVGLRILIGKIISEAAIIEKALEPILAYYADHYYRVYFKVNKGAKRTDELLEKFGYYYECSKCGFVIESKEFHKFECPRCKTPMRVAGPLWLGKLNDLDFIEKIKHELEKFSYLTTYNRISKLLEYLKNESKYNHYWRLDFLSSRIKTNVPKRQKVIECLGDGSFTHFDYRGIKTNKSYDEIVECIKISSNIN
ncbi:MAG: tRNA (guanine(10)-N(2))-dimethyltransferase [Sulfolobaceae archaeon]